MIYTLGKTDLYEKYLDHKPDAKKKGRTKDYEGGTVWETTEDAQKYINECCSPNEFSIYGVEADWKRDTLPEIDPTGYNSRSLKRDAKLVRLGEGHGQASSDGD